MSDRTPSTSLTASNRGPTPLSADAAAGLDQYVNERDAQFGARIAEAVWSPDSLVQLAQVLGNPRELDLGHENLLRGLEIHPDADVLELGCGWGTLTRYLAQHARHVDAVASDPGHADLTAARVSGLDNVNVFVGTLEDLAGGEGYDLVVIGDVESLGWDAADAQAVQRDLRSIASHLRTGGALVLAADNRLGVKVLAGGTDRPPTSLAGGGSLPRALRKFQPRELESLAESSGLSTSTFAVFPDRWSPRVVMDLESLRVNAPTMITRLPVFPSPDGSPALPRVADEQQLWRSWVSRNMAADVANAFLVIATKGNGTPLWPDKRLATYWSSGRKAAKSAENAVLLSSDGTVHVERRALIGDLSQDVSLVRFNPHDESVVEGKEFVDAIASASDLAAVGSLLEKWTSLMDSRANSDSAVLWDLVPHNLVLVSTAVHAIDQEWVLAGEDWAPVVRRGVFWLASRLAESHSMPAWLDAVTVAEAAVHVGQLVGLPSDGSWLTGFYDEEAAAVGSILPPDPRYNDGERVRELARHLQATGESEWAVTAEKPSIAERYRDVTMKGNPMVVTDEIDSTAVQSENKTGSVHAEITDESTGFAAMESELANTKTELDRTIAQVEMLELAIAKLRVEQQHTALEHRDHVVGLQAQLVTVRSQLRDAHINSRRANAKLKARNERLREQLDRARDLANSRGAMIRAMRASRTWRLGSVFVRPFSIFRSGK
jgi:2-polyprenyl-3-methyl-5-hydroxy-6-metoxy-1,4-benzoquinol methylase